MKYLVNKYKYADKPFIGRMRILNSDIAHRGGNTLINKQGLCEGIAEAFMMLLNNPFVKIDYRCLGGLADDKNPDSGHAWNIVKQK